MPPEEVLRSWHDERRCGETAERSFFFLPKPVALFLIISFFFLNCFSVFFISILTQRRSAAISHCMTGTNMSVLVVADKLENNLNLTLK